MYMCSCVVCALTFCLFLILSSSLKTLNIADIFCETIRISRQAKNRNQTIVTLLVFKRTQTHRHIHTRFNFFDTFDFRMGNEAVNWPKAFEFVTKIKKPKHIGSRLLSLSVCLSHSRVTWSLHQAFKVTIMLSSCPAGQLGPTQAKPNQMTDWCNVKQ